jgi:hypothetical protein
VCLLLLLLLVVPVLLLQMRQRWHHIQRHQDMVQQRWVVRRLRIWAPVTPNNTILRHRAVMLL